MVISASLQARVVVFSAADVDFNLPQHRYDLLWFVSLDRHDPLFLQVDFL
jgi:hypothetical protein